MLDLKEIVCTGDTLFRNERFMLDEMTYQDMLYFWNKKKPCVYFIIQKMAILEVFQQVQILYF